MICTECCGDVGLLCAWHWADPWGTIYHPVLWSCLPLHIWFLTHSRLLLFSCWVLVNSLQPLGLQHARLSCPSPSPWACSDSWPLSRWCHPTISSSVITFSSCHPSIRVFSNESTLCITWPNYLNFSLSISPSNEYSGLISFRIDWFGLLAAQETLRSLLQHHSSKASILQCSAFFMVQLSYPYMTTEKPIALTIWTIVGQVLSLVFNTLSRFVIAFLLKSRCFKFYGCSHHLQWF